MSKVMFDPVMNRWLNYFNEFAMGDSPAFKEGYDDPTYLTFKIEFGEWGASILNRSVLQSGLTSFSVKNADYDQLPIGLMNCPAPGDGHKAEIWQSGSSMDSAIFNNTENYSAFSYLRSRNEDTRAEYIYYFVNGLMDIQKNTPYIFKKITGIDTLENIDFASGQRIKEASITLECLEGLSLKMRTLMELYRKAAWDDTYQRWILPENMRLFKMIIYVFERRTFLDYMFGLDDINYDIPVKAYECSPCEFDLSSSMWGGDYDTEYTNSEESTTIKIKVKNVKTFFKNGFLNPELHIDYTGTTNIPDNPSKPKRSDYTSKADYDNAMTVYKAKKNDDAATALKLKLSTIFIYDLVDGMDRGKYSNDESSLLAVLNSALGGITVDQSSSINKVRAMFMSKNVFLSNEDFSGNSINHRTWIETIIKAPLWDKQASFWKNIGNLTKQVLTNGARSVMIGGDISLVTGTLTTSALNYLFAEQEKPYIVSKATATAEEMSEEELSNYTNWLLNLKDEFSSIKPRNAKESFSALLSIKSFNKNKLNTNKFSVDPKVGNIMYSYLTQDKNYDYLKKIKDLERVFGWDLIEIAKLLNKTNQQELEEMLEARGLPKLQIADLLNARNLVDLEFAEMLAARELPEDEFALLSKFRELPEDKFAEMLAARELPEDEFAEMSAPRKLPEDKFAKLLSEREIPEQQLSYSSEERNLPEMSFGEMKDFRELNNDINASKPTSRQITMTEFLEMDAPREVPKMEYKNDAAERQLKNSIETVLSEIRKIPGLEDITLEDARKIPEYELNSLTDIKERLIPMYEIDSLKTIDLISKATDEVNQTFVDLDQKNKSKEQFAIDQIKADGQLFNMVPKNDKDADSKKQQQLELLKTYALHADDIQKLYADRVISLKEQLKGQSIAAVRELPEVELLKITNSEKDKPADKLLSVNDIEQIRENLPLISLKDAAIREMSITTLISLEEKYSTTVEKTQAMIGLSKEVEKRTLKMNKLNESKTNKREKARKKLGTQDLIALDGKDKQKNAEIIY